MGFLGDLVGGIVGEKTVKCSKCGAEFQVNSLSGKQLCPKCTEEANNEMYKQASEQRMLDGIQSYYKDMPKPYKAMPADIQTIIAERDRILEKYRVVGITEEEMKNAYINTYSLSAEEREAFMMRACSANILVNLGASIAPKKFAVSHFYDGIAVDFEDVFCVSLVEASKVTSNTDVWGTYMVTLFTKNPFTPAMGFMFGGLAEKEALFGAEKRKKAQRQAITGLMTAWCPNLTYPVMEIKELKKTLKSERSVRGGALSAEFMTALADKAAWGSTPIFARINSLIYNIPGGIARKVSEFGYIDRNLFDELFLKDRSVKGVWEPVYDKASAEIWGFALEDMIKTLIDR